MMDRSYLCRRFGVNIRVFERSGPHESAPQPIFDIKQWITYTSTYRLPSYFHANRPFHIAITFGGKSVQKVRITIVGVINIHMLLRGITYFDDWCLPIGNVVPVFHGL